MKDQGLFHSNQVGSRLDFTILTGCLPIPCTCSPVQPEPIWVLLVLWTEEEPLRILCWYH